MHFGGASPAPRWYRRPCSREWGPGSSRSRRRLPSWCRWVRKFRFRKNAQKHIEIKKALQNRKTQRAFFWSHALRYHVLHWMLYEQTLWSFNVLTRKWNVHPVHSSDQGRGKVGRDRGPRLSVPQSFSHAQALLSLSLLATPKPSPFLCSPFAFLEARAPWLLGPTRPPCLLFRLSYYVSGTCGRWNKRKMCNENVWFSLGHTWCWADKRPFRPFPSPRRWRARARRTSISCKWGSPGRTRVSPECPTCPRVSSVHNWTRWGADRSPCVGTVAGWECRPRCSLLATPFPEKWKITRSSCETGKKTTAEKKLPKTVWN